MTLQSHQARPVQQLSSPRMVSRAQKRVLSPAKRGKATERNELRALRRPLDSNICPEIRHHAHRPPYTVPTIRPSKSLSDILQGVWLLANAKFLYNSTRGGQPQFGVAGNPQIRIVKVKATYSQVVSLSKPVSVMSWPTSGFEGI